jgi:hypothetical protein
MGNRGIVKPETFLRLPEMPVNHVFEIVFGGGEAKTALRAAGAPCFRRFRAKRPIPLLFRCKREKFLCNRG